MLSTSQKHICMVYVPCPKRRIAKKIAQTAICERLATCGNILGPSVSLFLSKNDIVSTREYVLILKTTDANFTELQKRVKEC